MSSSLQVKNVSVVFNTKKGPFHAIESINLNVAPGEFVCLGTDGGCSQADFKSTGGDGLMYCFAAN